MLDSVRYFLADLRHWLGRHRLAAAGTVIVLAAAAVAAYLLVGSGGDDQQPAPAPEVVVREVSVPEQTEELGFPAFATKNTTRVAGPDPVANAAGVALAVYPSTGGVPGPDAVTLVDEADWPAGIAASSLVAAPVGAPVLITESGDLPELTESAIRALGPAGSSKTEGAQLFVIGDAAAPDDYETLEVDGTNAAEVAAEVERLRARLAGKPEHIVIASSDEPEYAMPAASWAARSGDPILFVQRDSVPAVTRKALERREGTPVYVLGPSSVIPAKLMKEIERLAPTAERIGAQEPVENAIEFARFASGSFGWNINDPGHGLVIANTAEPLDAAAAAPLSASGTWGPLLVTDQAATVPATLRGYLLDLKPGYEDDPTRALYNHVWLIGDTAAVSVGFQAQVDEIAEVAPVTSGSGASAVLPGPGTVESAPDEPQPDEPDKPDQEPRR